ncbi:MAG: UPF0182 family protein [Clostridia bacterium]|nr:UPF0182 family protein [Clostridia bacterium]
MENKKKGGKIRIIFIGLIILIAALYKMTDFIIDYLWFKEMGYTSVFFTEIGTKLKLGIPLFLILTALGFLFLSILKSNFLKRAEMEIVGEEAQKHIRTIIIILSGVFGVVLSITTISALWFQILQYMNSTSFGLADPVFGQDLGFYMFKLEFLTALNSASINMLITLLGLTVLFYVLLVSFTTPKAGAEAIKEEAESYEYDIPGEGYEAERKPSSIGEYLESMFKKQKGKKKPSFESESKVGKILLTVASTQLMILGVLLFASVGINNYLRQYDLLYSGTGVAYGAGYTDINVTLLVYRALIGLSIIGAVVFAIALKKKNLKMALVIPALMVIVSLGGAASANLVQNLIVSPDEINKESEYLQNNITYTREAYGLGDISVKDFAADNMLTRTDVLNNMDTFSNIRINDFEPAERFYNQTQSIRTYYTFNDVDVDRYYVNGEYTQVFLSAREIDQAKTEDQWLIRHLKYTHGYGITLSRVDKVTSSGQPDMLIDSIPPVSEIEEIEITRPEIYFGESTDDYIITGTNEAEFDYPSGESNMYNFYEGEAGIKLNLFNRIMFALRERSLKILVSTNISSDSKMMIYRNIEERVQKIAPFLAYDDDPYVVTADGKIYWILDAYTMSSYYPYSEPWSAQSDMNYIRNSVKIVVDAYNGTTDFFIADETDPIVQTLQKIYPVLFKSLDEMPEYLKAHIHYPNALFNIQADVYKKYHMTNVEVFYQNEDLWDIAKEVYGQTEQAITPNYFIMRLPGEDKAEFINSIPYTPSGKSNMTGLLVARNDGDNYGDLILYRLPKDRVIYGPSQVEAQINQDAEISKEFSLWNNSGSTYSRGNMFVFPVEGSLIYVEPVYLEASQGSLPEVKRVIVYYNDRIAYKPTLAEALDALFGEGAGNPLNAENPVEAGREAAAILEAGGEIVPETPTGTQTGGETVVTSDLQELIRLANEAYEKALSAQKEGDWAGYGQYMNQLQQYLSQLGQ